MPNLEKEISKNYLKVLENNDKNEIVMNEHAILKSKMIL